MAEGFDGRRRSRRKVDRFLADKSLVIDYKDPSVLKYFVTDLGKIVPRRVSGLCAKNQRKMSPITSGRRRQEPADHRRLRGRAHMRRAAAAAPHAEHVPEPVRRQSARARGRDVLKM